MTTRLHFKKCGQPRRRGLWLPPRFRRGSWTIRNGVPLVVDGTITENDECCCCLSCCDEGTAPPQLELDARGIVMNPFLGCETGCNDFADLFLLDFRSVPITTVYGTTVGACLWRYCGTLACGDASPVATAFGWDVGIYSTGVACRAVAIPWLGGDCDDFSPAGGTDSVYSASLPTDPDDCCDALASPLSLAGTASGLAGQIGNKDATGGCEIFNIASNPITIWAVGCE